MQNGKLLQFAPPMEVYRQPASLFVAEFVGSLSINIFKAGDAETGAYHKSILDFLQARCPDIDQHFLSKIHTIGLRPEAIHISPTLARAPAGSWVQPVTVDTVLPTGPEWILSLRLGSTIIFVNTYIEPSYHPHDTIYIHCQGQCLHLFNQAGERLQNPFESEVR
jgi:ABC-type sugar transport system ATPase subunit